MRIEGGQEVEFCKQDMKQAYQASDPYELRVYDIGLILEAIELRANRGRVGKRLRPPPEPEPETKKDTDVEMTDAVVTKEEGKDEDVKMDGDEKDAGEKKGDDAKRFTKEEKGKGKEEEPKPKPKPNAFDPTVSQWSLLTAKTETDPY